MSLDLVIKSVTELDCDRIIVFGSVSKNVESPGDLDIAFDARDCESFDEVMKYHKETVDDLIKIARKYYGYFDPFIMTKNDLIVRNDYATGWATSKNKKSLLSEIINNGVKFEILFPKANSELVLPNKIPHM